MGKVDERTKLLAELLVDPESSGTTVLNLRIASVILGVLTRGRSKLACVLLVGADRVLG